MTVLVCSVCESFRRNMCFWNHLLSHKWYQVSEFYIFFLFICRVDQISPAVLLPVDFSSTRSRVPFQNGGLVKVQKIAENVYSPVFSV